MKTRTLFSIMLIAVLALSGILMITASGCNSPGTTGTAGVSPALPKINPEIRNRIISLVYSASKIAANAYINKMVADDKITADEATTYKQIVSDIKLPSPTAPEVTATGTSVKTATNLPAANNGSSGTSANPDIASP